MNLMLTIMAASALAVPAEEAPREVARVNHPIADLVLYNVRGECPAHRKQAALLYPDGNVIKGCWKAEDGFVFIIYEDGDGGAYPLRLFGGKGL